jgi:hypothetical protein
MLPQAPIKIGNCSLYPVGYVKMDSTLALYLEDPWFKSLQKIHHAEFFVTFLKPSR